MMSKSYHMPMRLKLALRSTRGKSSTFSVLVFTCILISLWVTGLGARFAKNAWLKKPLHSGRFLDDLSEAARNETLGFEKIFYISMPQSPRQHGYVGHCNKYTPYIAGWSTLSALNYIERTVLIYCFQVNGSSIHEKARPKGSQALSAEQLGCWRSHANVWRRIINERIQTAIILEDDADWDVQVHDIFRSLSVQIRKGKLWQAEPPMDEANAPYGLYWDLLYVGTCWNNNAEVRPMSHIYEDMNAPSLAEMSFAYQQELKYWGAPLFDGARVRVIAPSWSPVCTVGYAVTLQGAQKLLYTIGNEEGLGAPVDLAMISKIQSGHLKSLTVVPPLVTPWKTGSTSDSDIDDLTKAEGKLPRGSENLRYSGRVALAATLNKSFGG